MKNSKLFMLSPLVLLALGHFSEAQITINAANTVPSYMRSQQADAQQGMAPGAIVQEITKRLQEKLKSPSSPYKLSPEQIKQVASASQSPGYSQAIQAIISNTSKNASVIAINQVRLEMFAAISDINVEQNSSVKDLGTLAAKANPEALNAESLKNMAMFFDAVKKGFVQGASAQEVLVFAQSTLENGEGRRFDIEYIEPASKGRAGVNEIFFARSETRLIPIGAYTSENGSSKPVELSLSVQDAEKLSATATAMAMDLIDKAMSPQGRELLRQEARNEVDKDLEKSTEEAGIFLKGNKMLDRASNEYKAIEQQRLDSVQNVDELLHLLQEMGHKVGEGSLKGKIFGALRGAPLIGGMMKKIVPDPIDTLKTHRAKIEEVDRSLVNNANLLKENTAQLLTVLQRMGIHVHDLKLQMATYRIVADQIRAAAKDLRDQGRVEDADRLESSIGARIERGLSNAMGQISAMHVIGEIMNQQIDASNILREDINSVRNTAMPLFAASEMSKNAASTLEMAAQTNKAIRTAMENQLREIRDSVKRTNDLIIEINGTPVLNPEVLDEMATFLLTERDRMSKASLENKRKMEVSNVRMAEAFNRIEAAMGAEQAASCAMAMEQLGSAKRK